MFKILVFILVCYSLPLMSSDDDALLEDWCLRSCGSQAFPLENNYCSTVWDSFIHLVCSFFQKPREQKEV